MVFRFGTCHESIGWVKLSAKFWFSFRLSLNTVSQPLSLKSLKDTVRLRFKINLAISVYLPVCKSIYILTILSTYLAIYKSIHLSICISIHLYIIYLSSLASYPCTRPSFNLVCLCAHYVCTFTHRVYLEYICISSVYPREMELLSV